MSGAKRAALLVLTPFLRLLGLLLYGAIRLIEPVRRIQVGHLIYGRIGHLSGNTETFLRSRAAGLEDPKNVCVFVCPEPANRQLLEMIKRKLCVFEAAPTRLLYNHALKPFVTGTRFHQTIPCNSNEYDLFARVPSQLRSAFTAEDMDKGRRLLESMGVPAGKPFVCFHARDKAYLDQAHAYSTREQWSYHDYRDCDIENYRPAAELLADKGFYALRMGAIVEKPLATSHPRVIDYATKHRTDFGDIFLLAHCRFYLGNTAGVSSVCYSFDVPVALANLADIGYPPWRKTDLFIPKLFREAKSGRTLGYRELIGLGAAKNMDGPLYRRLGIEAVENTAEEIADLAEEMNARLDGTWISSPGDDEIQNAYRRLFPKGGVNDGYPSRVGAKFLRAHRDLLA